MIILSLFDGISAGMLALKRSGIKVSKYYASEIDKYAEIVSENNFPEIIRLGDINNWKSWDIEKPDLIIGGSPCQGFSFAGKGLNFDDERSKLFFVFVDILKYYKPEYFLLENVKMKAEHNDVISSILGEIYPECIEQAELFRSGRLEPVLINSALLSAQNRERLYWCNWEVGQPEDKGIMLKDILETGSGILNDHGNWKDKNDKANCIDANYFKGVDNHAQRTMVKCGAIRGRNTENPKSREAGLNTVQMLEIREDDKTNCLTSVQKDNVLCYTENYIQYDSSGKGHHSQGMRIYHEDKKSNCLNVCHSSIPKSKEIETETEIFYRKLTPIECERLQTFPDNFTNYVSNSQRYKCLGNSWTVDVISHIFNQIKDKLNAEKTN